MQDLIRRVAVLASMPVLAAAASVQPAASMPPGTVELADQSTFDAYQPFTEQAVAPWREMNDGVARIGGWREYAKEAQAAPANRPAPAASSGIPSAEPAPRSPHAGHGHE